MERYLKRVSVPTLCWAEIRSQAGLRHLDVSDTLTDQEYDRIIEVRRIRSFMIRSFAWVGRAPRSAARSFVEPSLRRIGLESRPPSSPVKNMAFVCFWSDLRLTRCVERLASCWPAQHCGRVLL